MATVVHTKTYDTKLISDNYVISETCCKSLKIVSPDWLYCPFCGVEIKYETSVVNIVEPKDATV